MSGIDLIIYSTAACLISVAIISSLGRMVFGAAHVNRTGTGAGQRKGAILAPWAWALLFALAMTALPWEAITGRVFPDLEVYLWKFEDGVPVMEEQDIQGVLSFIVNEALWDILIREAVNLTGLPPGDILLLVSFACFFAYAKYLFERQNLILGAIFLLNPLLITFGMSQLRLALAATLLLMAFSARSKTWRLIAVALAITIHTASMLFIIIYLVSHWIAARVSSQRMRKNVAVALLIFTGLAIVLAIGPARQVILGYLGDRRVEYEIGPASFLYGGFWFILLGFYAIQSKRFFVDEANAYAMVIVAVFVFSIIFGVFGSRFIAAAFPLVISSMMSVKREQRPLLLSLFSVFAVAQWYYWTR